MLSDELKNKIESLIKSNRIMLFMKGDKFMPQCGFSAKMVELLQSHNAEFTTYDILEDEDVRQGLKIYSNWPTYPQLYVDGKLIGGIDIAIEMEADDELAPLLAKAS